MQRASSPPPFGIEIGSGCRLADRLRRIGGATVVALGAAALVLPEAGLADVQPGRSMLPAVANPRDLPARFAAEAAAFEAELIERVMPYWYDTTIDREHGGYLLADDAVRPVDPPRPAWSGASPTPTATASATRSATISPPPPRATAS